MTEKDEQILNQAEIDKYVLEHARIEVEHTRSWPTKIFAFYLAINVGIYTVLSAVSDGDRASESLTTIVCFKKLAVYFLSLTATYVIYLLCKNHISYLRMRNIQIRYQLRNKDLIASRFEAPEDWFKEIEVCITSRPVGWFFYAFLTTGLAVFTSVAIYL